MDHSSSRAADQPTVPRRAAGPAGPTDAIVWEMAGAPVAYPRAVADMEARAAAIAAGTARERIWLVEHPPLYTAGTSARPDELLQATLPVFTSGRGGRFTYHGPGQRIAYVQLDLSRRGRDVRGFVDDLQNAVIATLARFGVSGRRDPDNIGVFVATGGGLSKIAAIGVRVRRWVTLHGLSLNVAPDLSHYGGIVPCGLTDRGVTSLRALGVDATLAEVDAVLRKELDRLLQPGGSGRCRPRYAAD
ncbi:MAG: lipoyl(octanoyl) transferase LipB [Alphaproteobacteria bacterium]